MTGGKAMTRAEAREHLQMGAELDGLVIDAEGKVLARGKIRWEGTTLCAIAGGSASHLQLQNGGGRLTVPLVRPVGISRGEPVRVEFGPAWKREERTTR